MYSVTLYNSQFHSSIESEISPNSTDLSSFLSILNIWYQSYALNLAKLKLEAVVFYVYHNKSMLMESSFVQPAISKFDGNYDHWAMLMENFLRSKEYWGLVENEIPAATEDIVFTDA